MKVLSSLRRTLNRWAFFGSDAPEFAGSSVAYACVRTLVPTFLGLYGAAGLGAAEACLVGISVFVGGMAAVDIAAGAALESRGKKSAQVLESRTSSQSIRVVGRSGDMTRLHTILCIVDKMTQGACHEPVFPPEQAEKIRPWLEDAAAVLARLELYDSEGRKVDRISISRSYMDNTGQQQNEVIGSIRKNPDDVLYGEALEEVEKIVAPSRASYDLDITAPASVLAKHSAAARNGVEYLAAKAEIDEALREPSPVARLRVTPAAAGAFTARVAEVEPEAPVSRSFPAGMKKTV